MSTRFTWATVTALGPLRVKLDGDSTALAFTPDSLIDPNRLSVSDRVRCEITGRRVTVLGRSGGYVAIPPGNVQFTARPTAPTGWLLCDGSAVSRTTYADLFAAINPTVGTFTITIASPGVITLTAHGLATGQQVYLTTTGALPTGLTANTGYFAIRVSSSTIRLATSLANALAGTAINTTGTQSGTHTLRTTWGVGNGSSTFNLPDLRGRAPVGVDSGQTEFAAPGETGGGKTVTISAAQLPAHSHPLRRSAEEVAGYRLTTTASGGGFTDRVVITDSSSDTSSSGLSRTGNNTGGGSAVDNLQPYVALNPIIKT